MQRSAAGRDGKWYVYFREDVSLLKVAALKDHA